MNQKSSTCSRAPTFALVLWIVGCGGGLSQLPDQGGPAWVRVDTPHFELCTDLEAEDAVAQVTQLEHTISGLLAGGWQNAAFPTVRVRVVLFRSRTDFSAFGSPNSAGYYAGEAAFEPLAVTFAGRGQDNWTTLQHELAHFIADRTLGPQPTWLAEGLATYFETARFDGSGNFVVGSVPRDRTSELTHGTYWGPSTIVSGAAKRSDPGFYPSTWLLVHYLFAERRSDFDAYLALLARGADAQRAFASAVGPIGALDQPVLAYRQRGQILARSYRFSRRRVQARVTRLSDADVLALRALLDSRRRADKRTKLRLQHSLARVHDLDPSHVLAAAVRFQQGDSILGLDQTERLVLAKPDSWLAWLLRFFALVREDDVTTAPHAPADQRRELERARRHLLRLGTRQPYAQMAAALVSASAGRCQTAMTEATTGLSTQPLNPNLLRMHAEVAASCDHCQTMRQDHLLLRNVLRRHGDAPDLSTLDAQMGKCAPSREIERAPL